MDVPEAVSLLWSGCALAVGAGAHVDAIYAVGAFFDEFGPSCLSGTALVFLPNPIPASSLVMAPRRYNRLAGISIRYGHCLYQYAFVVHGQSGGSGLQAAGRSSVNFISAARAALRSR